MNPGPDEQTLGPRPDEIATLLVDDVVAALVNVRIYAASHPRVTGSLAAVKRLVGELSDAVGEDPIAIGCAENLLIFQQRPMLSASLAAVRLVETLHEWGGGGIEIGSKVTVEDLAQLLALLIGKHAPGENFEQLNERLVERGCRTARLLPPYAGAADGAHGEEAGSELNIAVRFYQQVVDVLQDITVSVCRGGRIQFDPVRALADQLLARLEADESPLLSLARHDQYDAFTFGHSVRVSVLAMTFARALTKDRDLIVRIGIAALLHDVGKALVPFELLHCNRRLTSEEFRAISQHPVLGAEILLDHSESDPMAIAAAFGHHQTADGRGYPQTAHDHHISKVTEIIKICDVYEALTAARPYKQPMSPVRAYRVMLSMGDKFDRAMLRKFIEVNGVFPVGQAIELNTGETAVVRKQTNELLRPQVELLANAAGDPVDPDDNALLDLSDLGCCAARKILCEVDAEPSSDAATTALSVQNR